MSVEKLEYEDDTIPYAIREHYRQIDVEEEKETICDRIARLFQDVERGQTYPINTFK